MTMKKNKTTGVRSVKELASELGIDLSVLLTLITGKERITLEEIPAIVRYGDLRLIVSSMDKACRMLTDAGNRAAADGLAKVRDYVDSVLCEANVPKKAAMLLRSLERIDKD